jgi:small subunit ribosomal protein S6
MIVISPDVPEEEIQSVIDRTGEFITEPGGTLTSINRDSPWGRRRLSYPIRHNSRDVRDGFYTLYQFTIEPHKIEDIEREIRLTDRIIRYLVTQYTPRAEAPVAEAAEGAEGEEIENGETAEVASEDIVIDETPAAVEA